MDGTNSFEFMNIRAVNSNMWKNKYIYFDKGISHYFVVSLI